MPVRNDPFPQFTRPGVFYVPDPCPSCIRPDSNPTMPIDLPGGATSIDLRGNFTGTLIAPPQWYAISPQGGVNQGIIPVTGPSYAVTVPVFCGTTTIKCVFDAAAGRAVLVTQVVRSNCVEADIRITLTWDDKGRDGELHLIRPAGKLNDTVNRSDCTWNTCIGTGPDWGVPGDASDDPLKDVDNTGAYGPENIFLSKPENGSYAVMVEHWGGGEPSKMAVSIFFKGRLVFAEEMPDLRSHHVWDVARIDWQRQSVTSTKRDIDCTMSWGPRTAGCDLDLP